MGTRSKVITDLPREVRDELERKLIDRGFSGYQALSDWLEGRGYAISLCSLRNYGRKLEKRLDAIKLATEQAKAIVEAAPDEDGAMNDALLRLIQEKLFLVLVDSAGAGKLNLPALARTIGALGRAWLDQKRFEQQMRARLSEKVKAADAQVAKTAAGAGLTAETTEAIRNALLGIGQ